MVKVTKRESSLSRNERQLAYSMVSKIFSRSRGRDSSLKFWKPNMSGLADAMNGQNPAAATLAIPRSNSMSP